MFDSDNIPLVTRIERGDGVLISYSINSDEEGVWKVTIDSDYILDIIKKNESSAYTIETRQRVENLESALGVSAPTIDSDSDRIRYLYAYQDKPKTSAPLIFTWNISDSNNKLVSATVTVPAGTTIYGILQALQTSVNNNSIAMNYLSQFNIDDNMQIKYKFVLFYTFHTFNVVVDSSQDKNKFVIS